MTVRSAHEDWSLPRSATLTVDWELHFQVHASPLTAAVEGVPRGLLGVIIVRIFPRAFFSLFCSITGVLPRSTGLRSCGGDHRLQASGDGCR